MPSRNGGGAVSDLRDVLALDLIAALENRVDRRVAAALADRENGSHPTWLSIEEAAEYLRVTPSTIGRMLRNYACARRTSAAPSRPP